MLGLQPATRQAQMGWILEELSLSLLVSTRPAAAAKK